MRREKAPENWGLETLCQHLGDTYEYEGAVVPPLFQTSLFVFEDGEEFLARESRLEAHYFYTRIGNPTIEIAERKIAALERTEACRLLASGMAAVASAVLSVAREGSHILVSDNAYGPTRRLIRDYLPRFGICSSLVDMTDLDGVRRSFRPETCLVYLESPGSFFFQIQDLSALCSIAKEHGCAVIVDNSTATPYFQNPALYGADYVVHSATKYLGGHSDVVAGAVCGEKERLERLNWEEAQLVGATLDPFAAWLLVRSLRTFPLRMERHFHNGLKVAEFLASHPKVERVYYPWLSTHPNYEVARRQMRGASGMLSFEPKFQERATVLRFCESLRLFQIGVSWGGHESLCVPACSEETKGKWVIRLSVGLETVEDLIEDLQGALEGV
jgi:cystathionine beta-lyase/cystathionine gamma-synthase